MNTDVYSWFESEWQARISQIRYQPTYSMTPFMMGSHSQPDVHMPVQHVPIMKVEISEPDLIHMIRDLRDAHAHAQVQQRYPQLREAYMNYLSQVYLTVDKFPLD